MRKTIKNLRNAGLPDKIPTVDLPNTKQEAKPLQHNNQIIVIDFWFV
jgi:hypothetical protein